jgi:hypothetical protein
MPGWRTVRVEHLCYSPAIRPIFEQTFDYGP